MYEVIGGLQSRTFRVLWMLEELGEGYTHRPEKTHSELVLSLNPSGKIPIMREGDAVLTDSTAIITYLADKHGQLTHPAGTIARAHQDGLTQLVLDEIDAVLWDGGAAYIRVAGRTARARSKGQPALGI